MAPASQVRNTRTSAASLTPRFTPSRHLSLDSCPHETWPRAIRFATLPLTPRLMPSRHPFLDSCLSGTQHSPSHPPHALATFQPRALARPGPGQSGSQHSHFSIFPHLCIHGIFHRLVISQHQILTCLDFNARTSSASLTPRLVPSCHLPLASRPVWFAALARLLPPSHTALPSRHLPLASQPVWFGTLAHLLPSSLFASYPRGIFLVLLRHRPRPVRFTTLACRLASLTYRLVPSRYPYHIHPLASGPDDTWPLFPIYRSEAPLLYGLPSSQSSITLLKAQRQVQPTLSRSLRWSAFCLTRVSSPARNELFQSYFHSVSLLSHSLSVSGFSSTRFASSYTAPTQ